MVSTKLPLIMVALGLTLVILAIPVIPMMLDIVYNGFREEKVKYTPAECLEIARVPPVAIIKVSGCVKTLEDYIEHAKVRIALLRRVAEAKPDEILLANIHFREPLSVDEAFKLVEEYDLQVVWYSALYLDSKGDYVAGSSGRVFNLSELRARLQHHVNVWKSRSNIEYLEVKLEGFIVKANASVLYEVQRDDRVFLVDIGPYDLIVEMKFKGYKYIDMRWINGAGWITGGAYFLYNKTKLPKIQG